MTPSTLTIRVVREADVPAGPTCARCSNKINNYCYAFGQYLHYADDVPWSLMCVKCAPCLTACAEAEQRGE